MKLVRCEVLSSVARQTALAVLCAGLVSCGGSTSGRTWMTTVVNSNQLSAATNPSVDFVFRVLGQLPVAPLYAECGYVADNFNPGFVTVNPVPNRVIHILVANDSIEALLSTGRYIYRDDYPGQQPYTAVTCEQLNFRWQELGPR